MSYDDMEKTDLGVHVVLCSERFKQLEHRMTTVEEKITSLQSTVEKSSLNTIKVLIGTAGTIIVAVLSLVGVIISKVPQ